MTTRCALLLIGAAALGGCDRVFGLHDVAIDASHDDGGGSDSGIDADRDPSTHDEDGDGIPDISDDCPGFAVAQGDSDGDSIGDACDPHPDDANDIVVLSEFFEIPPQRLVEDSADNWKLDGDSLVTAQAPGDTNATLMFTAPTDAPSIELKFRPLAYSGGDASIAIALDFPMGQGLCTIATVGSADALAQVELQDNNQDATVPLTPVAVGKVVTVQLVRDATSTRCNVGGVSPGDVVAETREGDMTATITVVGMTVELQYVILYDNEAMLR